MLIERMGLDQPVWWQIIEFFRNALTGNLGYDVWSNRPVSTLVHGGAAQHADPRRGGAGDRAC